MTNYHLSRQELAFHRRTTTRLTVAGIVMLLFAILVYQNAGPVPITVFFWEFQGNRLVVVAARFFAGLLFAWIAQRLALRRRLRRQDDRHHRTKGSPKGSR